MADVVHSVNLDQRLDFPHDPVSQYYPHNTPATIAITTPVQPLSASFGGFDLTGELAQSASCVNFFEPSWSFIAAMTLQLSEQDSSQSNVSSSQQQQQQQQQNSRQFNEMTAAAFPNQYSHDTSVQQTSILQPSPPFVEPSGNYIAIPSTTTNQTLPYGYPSSNLPNNNNNNNNLDNGNVCNNFSSINSRNAYMGNSNQQPQQHQQHQQQHQHHHPRIDMTNQLIQGYNFNPNHCLHQKEIYQTSIPSSIGTNSCQQHHDNHQKSIPRSVNSISSNYSRQEPAATSLPISIAPNLFVQSFNNQTNNGSTMMVPLFDHSTTMFNAKPTTTPIPPTISISQNSPTSESSSPTKQAYSYSGPPKSYYSRLPLYDRPFKCDECPQSFNRNHDLKRHKRIHLAVKPYPCQYCEKQFSRKDALKRHVLVKGCNNTSNNNSKRLTSPNNNNNNNKNVGTSSPTNPSISTIKSYVDSGSPIKTEPTSDNNGYGMSI
jgi:uncharacterized Zn-finger protein